MNTAPNAHILVELVTLTMPFGKHKGLTLCQLPVSYLEWFNRKGFPTGKLGTQLQLLYEIKLNGLEHLLIRIKEDISGNS
ncbi:MAG: DUF3820 family protein [Bacteroidia bacterium]|nr:DUF3820 family protein [Bacteroidia bacterium]